MRALRGATTVVQNNKDEILSEVSELILQMIEKNSVHKDDIVSIIFSMTPDLDAVFPAQAARQLGLTDVPLMCFAEIDVKDSLEKCIRIMINFLTNKNNKDLIHVYLNKAVELRPDLVIGDGDEKNQDCD